MQIRVLLFAALREAAATSELRLDLAPASTAGTVLAEIARRLPERRPLLECCALAVNEEYADTAVTLHEGDVVAVIPPVSGGCVATTTTTLEGRSAA